MTEPDRAEPRAVGSTASEGSKERAGIVGAGTLLSRILGFGRDAVIAALFTRRETDAFWVALTIPNALRQLLAEGAVSSAVVPVLSERLAKGGDEVARPFFARARGVSIVALLVVTLLGIVFARELTWLFASGYSGGEKFELTTSLTRVMFPYILFMGTAALGMAALNAKRRFAVAAFAPALFSVGIVGAAFLLREPLAERGIDPAMTLAIGVLAGGVMQVVAQIPALRKIGYASLPRFDFRDPHVREMLKRILPMTFGLGVYYVDLVLSRRFLSELGEGAQSWFSWASRLCDLPQGISRPLPRRTRPTSSSRPGPTACASRCSSRSRAASRSSFSASRSWCCSSSAGTSIPSRRTRRRARSHGRAGRSSRWQQRGSSFPRSTRSVTRARPSS